MIDIEYHNYVDEIADTPDQNILVIIVYLCILTIPHGKHMLMIMLMFKVKIIYTYTIILMVYNISTV